MLGPLPASAGAATFDGTGGYVSPITHSRFSSKATACAPRDAALYEIIERLLRFDPLPYDPALDT